MSGISLVDRRYVVVAAILCATLLLPGIASGQKLAFEVASIKPAEPITPAAILSGKVHLGVNIDGARVDIGYLSLGELIPMAFKVKPYQVAGPDWLRAQRFDILAKLPEGSNKDQVPEMLQSLLEERFQLKVHRENRESNVYALVEVKGGHKMKEALPDPETPPADAPGAITVGRGENQIRVTPGNGRGGATVVTGQTGTTRISPGPDGTMHMDMGKVSMPVFAEMLTPFLDRPVVDLTELKGNYQVGLDLSMETMLTVARAAGVGIPALGARGGGDTPALPNGAADPAGSSIFTSVQQLGLRLEPRKAPAEFIVIDRVEKMPTEN